MVGIVKLLIVGDAGVGKTAFVKRLTQNFFEKNYIETIGVDAGKRVGRFEISDFAGQEKFQRINAGDYAGANFVIVMCDFTSKHSLKSVSGWISKINDTCGPIPIVLCANKSDSAHKVFTEQQLVKSFRRLRGTHQNLIGVFPISVKANDGLLDVLASF